MITNQTTDSFSLCWIFLFKMYWIEFEKNIPSKHSIQFIYSFFFSDHWIYLIFFFFLRSEFKILNIFFVIFEQLTCTRFYQNFFRIEKLFFVVKFELIFCRMKCGQHENCIRQGRERFNWGKRKTSMNDKLEKLNNNNKTVKMIIVLKVCICSFEFSSLNQVFSA